MEKMLSNMYQVCVNNFAIWICFVLSICDKTKRFNYILFFSNFLLRNKGNDTCEFLPICFMRLFVLVRTNRTIEGDLLLFLDMLEKEGKVEGSLLV